MVSQVVILVSIFMIETTLALPAINDALDKVTVVDISANSVNPEHKPTITIVEEQKRVVDNANSDSDVLYHSPVDSAPPLSNVAKPGVAIARIIDDIFQIPIGVLQSVSRLLSNPFIQRKTPETASSY